MKVYTCNDFTPHWPTGAAAIIVANDKGHAKRLLNKSLDEKGLGDKNKDQDFTFEELDVGEAWVEILHGGDY